MLEIGSNCQLENVQLFHTSNLQGKQPRTLSSLNVD